MKKKIIIVPILLASMSLVACGGSASTSSSVESTSASIQQTEQATTTSASTNSIFSDNYSRAAVWVNTSFNKSAIYSELGTIKDKSGDYFQIVIPSDYTSSDAKKAFSEVSASMSALVISGINYKEISIKYVDKDYKEIVDFSLKLDSSGKYSLDVVGGDLQNSTTISNSLK